YGIPRTLSEESFLALWSPPRNNENPCTGGSPWPPRYGIPRTLSDESLLALWSPPRNNDNPCTGGSPSPPRYCIPRTFSEESFLAPVLAAPKKPKNTLVGAAVPGPPERPAPIIKESSSSERSR